jgi:hypothetical protein
LALSQTAKVVENETAVDMLLAVCDVKFAAQMNLRHVVAVSVHHSSPDGTWNVIV